MKILNTILNQKKGLTFFIVIAILAILLIAITSYNSMLRSERYTMYRIIYGDDALIIAEAGMDLLQRIVENEFALTGYERKNTYFKYEDLIKPKGEFKTVNFDSAKLTNIIANSEPIKALVDIFGGPSIARIKKVEVVIDENTVKYFADVCGTTSNIAPNYHEKFGIINYSIQVEFYGVTKMLNIAKQIKIVHTLPKVFRFFTLFIKNIPKDTDLNKILVDDSGNPVTGKPLVLNNGEYNSGASLSPLDVGMVFLGNTPASEPLILKLSHGTKGVGELFQMIESFYKNPDYEKDYKDSKGFQVVNLQYGVSSGMMAKARAYGIQSQKDLMSSMLKLYGTPDNPTPTRVLGNVNRSYLRLAAYQNTPNGSTDVGEMPSIPQANFKTSGVRPIIEKGVRNPPEIRPGEWIARLIFPEAMWDLEDQLYKNYALYMNQFISYEYYNFGFQSPIKDRNGFECNPNRIPDYDLKLKPSGTNSHGGSPAKPADEEYRGSDMRTISIDDKYAVPYASYKFAGDADFADFKKLFMNGTQPDSLRLGMMVKFAGDVKLPKMTIDKGGIIVCEKGNITISGDIEANPMHNQVLTLIAMDGDIIVDAAKVDAILITMKEGQKFTPRKKLELSGGLATHSMDFDKLLAAGGTINFRPPQTNSSNTPYFYYASIQPDVRNWKVILTNEQK